MIFIWFLHGIAHFKVLFHPNTWLKNRENWSKNTATIWTRKRPACRGSTRGETLTDIVKAVELSVATVFYPKCYLWECGTVQRKSGSGKEPTVMTNCLLGVKRNRTHLNLVHTMRGMASETRVSKFSICKAVKLNGARSLNWNSKFLLMDSLKAARQEKYQRILSTLKKNHQ